MKNQDYDILFKYEREIIIMLLGDEKNKKRERIINHLSSKMFIHKAFSNLFEIIKDLYENDKEINLYTVMEQIPKERRNDLEDLYQSYITCINCDYYITKIQDSYFDRIAEQAVSVEVLEQIKEERIKYALKDDLKHIGSDTEETIKKYLTGKGEVKIPYQSIAKTIPVIKEGEVMILAGGTGMGKTCMSLNLINRLQKDYKVSFYSLEMSKTQLEDRIITNKLGIDGKKLRDKTLTKEEFEKYCSFRRNELQKMNILISEKRNVTIPYIRELEKTSGSDLIVIDYLGLITPSYRAKRYEAITEISRAVKCLAGEVGKPIILLHQINRDYMSREDKRPLLSDLRDSGAIEQDADFVCFVHRPFVTGERPVDDHIEFIVRKNRFGSINTVANLIFNGATQEISDLREVVPNFDSVF